MPQTIILATNNAHKLSEMQAILGSQWQVLPMAAIGCTDDIPEHGTTLRDNALQKARYVAQRFGVDCIADDTGLEVDALGGAPGVHTARFAPGTDHDPQANMRHLLHLLEGTPGPGRTARFRTVIALVRHGHDDMFFEGQVQGTIAPGPCGTDGFGYDPVFIPGENNPHGHTFAQMPPQAKNAISHRGRATRLLAQYLETQVPDPKTGDNTAATQPQQHNQSR